MRKTFNVLGIVFLICCGIIIYSNYVSKPIKIERVYIDTCFIDSVKNDSL